MRWRNKTLVRQATFEDSKGVAAQAANALDGPSNAREKPTTGFAGAGYGGWRLAETTGPVEFPQQPALQFVEILQNINCYHVAHLNNFTSSGFGPTMKVTYTLT